MADVTDASAQPGAEGLTYRGPHAVPAFRDIADPCELGAIAEPHRLRWGHAMRSSPASPLFNRAGLPERVADGHDWRHYVPGAEFYAIGGHELGSCGLLQRDGCIFVNDRVQPDTLNAAIGRNSMPAHWMKALVAPDATVIEADAPVGVTLNPHVVWGHFLFEMMARVHLLAKLRMLGHSLRIAVPTDAPGWVSEFVALYFSDEETLRYDSRHQRVRAPCFVLPSMMMEHYCLHPEVNVVVQDLLDRVVGGVPPGPDMPRRIYLSRSRHRGWHGIANELEVEATLTDLGFTVLHPQTMPLREQLAIYAGAECIVSQFSSAAHNALFAPMGTPVFCLGWMNRLQSSIAALRGNPLAYMSPSDCDLVYPPADREPGVFRFHIDCRALARELTDFLRFAEQWRVPPTARGVPVVRERISEAFLSRASWHYGRDGEDPSTLKLQFLPDGRIGGYDYPNERRWSLDGGVLSILNESGQATASFERLEVLPGRVVMRAPYLPVRGSGIVLRLERAEP